MKIAIHNAQFSYHVGGTERLIFDQCRALLCYPDIKLTVVSAKTRSKSLFFRKIERIKNKNLKIKTFDGAESLKIKCPYTSNNPAKWHMESFIFGSEAYNYYKKNKFDAVITHFATDSLFIPPNPKNILHLHGTPLEASELGGLSMLRPDAFVSVSQNVKDGWIKLYPDLKNKNIKVVYPNIDHNKFRPKSTNKDIDILFVGRFILIKGIHDLLMAVSLLGKDIRVVLVGDGPEKENIRKTIEKMRLGAYVQIRSNVSDKELAAFYHRAKVAAFPSFAKEGMVLAMLEAASSGCAIVTSNACSMPEFVKDFKTGLLAEPRNPKDLAKKIRMLLDDTPLREAVGKNARDEIVMNWKTKKRMQELYQFYKEVMKR
ncbi:MAG: glycosyltransferase family 4 protein [Nanoarchaeota archaeon]|nr:glycosyltransferase family 4 protein [Nanoarchaeota archaeon]